MTLICNMLNHKMVNCAQNILKNYKVCKCVLTGRVKILCCYFVNMYIQEAIRQFGEKQVVVFMVI